jgi:predicted nucleotidyltransferase
MLEKQLLEDTTRVTPEVIEHICQRIVQAIDPKKIIVFGSVARDESTESSDLDILVIVDGSWEMDCREIARKIDRLFFGRRFGMDIIVRTDEQIEYHLQRGHPFYAKDIFAEGKVLYDKSRGA